MPDDEIGVALNLKGRGRFSSDARRAQDDIDGIGHAAERASRSGGIMSRTFGGLRGVVSGVAGVVARGTAVIGAAVGGLTTAAVVMGVKAQAAWEQASIGFTTMLGSASKAKSFMGELQTFAAKTPFELPGLIQGSQQLLAYGFNAKDIIPLLTKVGDASAGLGAGQEGIDRIVRGLGQIKAKGKASAEEMMQLAELGIPAWQFLADKIGVSIPEAMDKVSKGQVGAATTINAILEGMGNRFGGLMEKQSTSIGGLWSTLHDTVTQSTRQMVEPFQDDIKRALSTAITWVGNLGKAIPPVAKMFRAGIVGKSVGELSGAAGAAYRLARFFRSTVGLAKSLWATFQSGGALGVADQFDKMIGSGTHAHDILAKIMQVAGDVWTIIRDGFLPAWRDVNSLLPTVLSPMRQMDDVLHFMARHAKALKPLILALVAAYVAHRTVMMLSNAAIALNNLLTTESTSKLALQSAWVSLIAIKEKAAAVASGIWTAAQWLLNAAMDANPIGLLVVAIGLLIGGLVLAYTKSETFRKIVQGAMGAVVTAAKWVWNFFKNNWPLLLAIITGPFGLAVWAITHYWDSIRAGVGAVLRWIKDRFSNVVKWFSDLPGHLGDIGGKIASSIKNGVRSGINWIIRAWNSLQFTFPKKRIFGHTIGGWTIGTPDIPELHRGGTLVTGGVATIQPDEEMVILPPRASVVPLPPGGQEAVPLSVGGDGKPVTIQVMLDGRVLAETVWDNARTKQARS